MGDTYGFIMIKGDHVSQFTSIMSVFGLQYIGNNTSFDSFDDTLDFLAPNQIEWKGVTLIKGWTLILDTERDLIFKSDILRKLSKTLEVPIFALSIFDNACWYQFSYFDGDKIREYLRNGDEILDDKGEPLACESVKDKWGGGPGPLEIMEVMCNISLEDLEEHQGYELKEFDVMY